MNIQDKIFNKALVDGKYDKQQFIQTFHLVIGSEPLTENETTLINFLVQEYNDKNINDLTLLNFIEKLQSSNSNSAALSLITKIKDNTEINSQLLAYQEQKKKDNRKWIIGFFILALLAALFLAWKFNYIKLPTGSAHGGNMAVIDVDMLAYSATTHVINKNLGPEQSQVFANQYRDQLQALVEDYLDKGYILVNRKYVYAYSRNNDITYDLLNQLGIKPVDDSEFKTKYSGTARYDVLRNYAAAAISDTAQEAEGEQQAQFNNQAQQQLNSAEIMTNADGQSIDVE
ncbi:MAG: hypothetical protein PHG15_00595 [Acinetobacter sp.]|uniref:hypothetical protein n=1 Tax=Acinetobacter sp. TaxID=472 RepID=UPI00261944B1|nr:hypothetical protein [Acinetobacter sp.]MDD2944316.1 hypothetical protein [Acinetobacter sp.]